MAKGLLMENIIREIFEVQNDNFIKSDENFLSEKDLQFNFARMLEQKHCENVILEYPIETEKYNHSDIFNGKNAYIDICCEYGSKKYYIELKYKTSKKEITRHKLKRELKNHYAYYDNIHSIYKDIFRLEQVVKKENGCGYVLFLTNADYYKTYPLLEKIKNINNDYPNKPRLNIKGHYGKTDWKEFIKHDDFNYLLVEILNNKGE